MNKGLLGGVGHLRQRRLDDLEPLAGGRRRQRGPRLQPHDPRLPLGRRDRGVQDPAQQLRRRVRPGGRGAGQPRHQGRDQHVPRHRVLLRAPGLAELDRTTSWSRRASPRRPSSGTTSAATFGGPILKDKLHFFLSYEKNKDARTRVRSGFVPTAAERAGRLQRLPSRRAAPRPIPNDPLTGQPFPGNRIPGQPPEPAGVAFLKLYQLPNDDAELGLQQLRGGRRHADQVGPDQRPDGLEPQQQHARDGPLHAGQLGGQQPGRRHDASGATRRRRSSAPTGTSRASRSWPSSTRPSGRSMTNTLTFSYSANTINVTRTGDTALVDEINHADPDHLPRQPQGAGRRRPAAVLGRGPATATSGTRRPWTNNQDLYVLKDDCSAVFGKHFLKAGRLPEHERQERRAGEHLAGIGAVLDGAAGFLTPTATCPA